MCLQVADRTNMDAALRGICGKQLWLEIHQLDFVIPVLLDHDLAFKVFSQIQKDLLLAKIVAEKEDAVVHVGPHYVHQSLVGFFAAWKVVLWVRKCVIKVKIVDINGDAMEVGVASADRAEPLIVEHGFAKPKVSCVQHVPHLALKQKHHRSRAVKSVHEDYLNSIIFVLI